MRKPKTADARFLKSLAIELRQINKDEAAYKTQQPKTISYAELVARHQAKKGGGEINDPS